jgi:hypothetical protein
MLIQAALQDLKTYLKDLTTATPPSLRRADFADDISYEDWKHGESKAISELMVNMIQANPQLAKYQSNEVLPSLLSDGEKSTEKPEIWRTTSDSSTTQRRSTDIEQLNIVSNRTSRPDISRRVSLNDEETDNFIVKSSYTFIPDDSRAYYKRLIEACLKAQKTEPMTEGEYDEGSLLSKSTRTLLNECAVRWRVHPAARISLLLDVVRQMYDHEELDIQDINEAFTIADNWNYSSWPNADVSLCQ